MQGQWQYFPSVDDVLKALEQRAESRFAEREAQRTQQLLEESRETRRRLQAEGLPSGAEQFQGLVGELKAVVHRVPAVKPSEIEGREVVSSYEPLTEAELADRREILRQQAARLTGEGEGSCSREGASNMGT